MYHPKLNDDGEKVELKEPSFPTEEGSWYNPLIHATTVPGHKIPEMINGILFKKWSYTGDWNHVRGQGDFKEPELRNLSNKRFSTGVIICEPDDRIWTISPSNSFGGYINTLGPKGCVEKHLNPRANAIKEAYEETGLKVKLIGHALDLEKTHSYTRYYYGVREDGHPSDMGWETQAVHLLPKSEVENHVNLVIDKKAVRKLFGE